ncbi:MAG: O-antigen ligase family protein [Kiritimatiellae bacterium]|nr:O-antigen ligase family protein [Kiritimatiellia bacterium]
MKGPPIVQQWFEGCRTAGVSGFVRLALAAVMFWLPVSIAAAQASAVAAIAGWAWTAVRRRSSWWLREPLWAWAFAFWVVAALSAVFGWRPAVSLPKLHRAAWFLLLAAVPDSLPDSPAEREAALWRLVWALLGGCAVALALHFVRLGRAILQVPPGVDWLFWIYHQGSMRTPQFHMVAMLLVLAACTTGAWRGPRRAAALGWISNAAGVVLHFKRGVWLATAGGLLALLAAGCRLRPRVAAAVLVGVAALLCCPPVRSRVCDAPRQFLGRGGRWELWTSAVPRILEINGRGYPFGLGYGGMKNYELRHHVPGIETKLSHVHNNALQVLLETGWAGLVVWCGWMVHWLVRAAGDVHRGSVAGAPPTALGRGIFAAAIALLLNGVVEYNFGTGTVLILMAMLMGCTLALGRWRSTEPAGAGERSE